MQQLEVRKTQLKFNNQLKLHMYEYNLTWEGAVPDDIHIGNMV